VNVDDLGRQRGFKFSPVVRYASCAVENATGDARLSTESGQRVKAARPNRASPRLTLGLCAIVITQLLGCASHDSATSEWTSNDGQTISPGPQRGQGLIVDLSKGNRHCGWHEALVLTVGWPIGSEAHDISTMRWYVWDPNGTTSLALQGQAASSVDPPADIQATGLKNARFELFVAPSTADDFLYLRHNSTFDQWPRSRTPVICD
jgi:hypothetical protein